MSTKVQFRRGTTTEHSTFTGAVGEITVDTTKDTVVVHDGAAAGGAPLLREDQSNLPTSAPTTGIYNASGSLAISTNGTGRLFVDASGNVEVSGTGKRIRGDFTSTVSDRLSFQTNVTNGATTPILLPNGTGSIAGLIAASSSDPTNTNFVQIRATSTTAELLSSRTGTGTVQPLYITTAGSADIIFQPNAAERLRITSAGLVGIGTSSPTATLNSNGTIHVTGAGTPASGAGIEIGYASAAASTTSLISYNRTGSAWLDADYRALSHQFFASGTERARIDSSGRLLVGTSTATGGLLDVATSAGNGAFVAQFKNTNTANDGRGILNLVGNSSGDVNTLVFAGGRYFGADSDTLAVINNAAGGGISFCVGGIANSTRNERMRIDANGYATIFRNASNNTARLQFDAASTRIEYSDASGHLSFYTNSSARVRVNYTGGFVPVTDNSQTLGTSSERWTAVYAVNGTIQTSDLREKTEVTSSVLGSDFIKQLRPVSYKWNVGENVITKAEDGETDVVTPRPGERTHWGFIAQEVKEAVDNAGVDFGGWILTDKDDPDSTQGLRYDQFIAPLTKALQEALERIETLEAKVAALESA